LKAVLWLAPYPYELVGGVADSYSHPAPWITELAKEISNYVELTIVNYSSKLRKDVDEFESGGIRFVFVRTPRFRYDLVTFFRLRINRLVGYLQKKQGNFDLIHVHGTEHQCQKVAEKLGLPYVISIQGIMDLYRPYLPQKSLVQCFCRLLSSHYEKSGGRNAKYFFCRTHWDQEFVRGLNPEAKIFFNWEIIRRDFFIDLFNPYSRTLLFMGGTNLFKGIREVLCCLDILKREDSKFTLQICGKGDWDEIAKFVKQKRLDIKREDIKFMGLLTGGQLCEVFKGSFCLLHPSYMDNSPNSVCEAQVAGLPVIASNVGGVSSLIADGKTGLLVKRYDYENLAKQVMRLTNDKYLYESISRNARTVARRRHNRETIVSNTLEAYKYIIDSQPM
jgi:glycosyltransferase involved in cell wall biosynthesis